MKNIHHDKVIILDFGSQYTQLIARRIRECGVFSEIYSYDVNPECLTKHAPKGIILSGGPKSVTALHSPQIPSWVFEQNCPVLGICYGMQAMAAHFKGVVSTSEEREFGHSPVQLKPHVLFEALDGTQCLDTWMSHGDKVTQLPEGFECIASSPNAPIAAMASLTQPYYGLQFHPEVTHTQQGHQIIENFVHNVCRCKGDWTSENIVEEAIVSIREKVKHDKVVLGLSGGVDSSVVAALLHRAIGDQLICVFVDNGLLRQNEVQNVMDTFSSNMGLNIICKDAKDIFLNALKGQTCPETKRKIIGQTFIDVFEAQAKELGDVKWLAQGTIYPDVIESAASSTQKAHVIKSHHNVGGLPDVMNLKLIEPLKELFKDEVRSIGEFLGLPKAMVYRHPFPGPGLAVRVLGEIKEKYLDILRRADAIFIETLIEFDHYDKVSQAFAVFLPVKSVGVVGDARQYEYVICIRAVTTQDFMTAHWAHLPYELLEKVSSRILNEVNGVSRVTYDISSKPPATIEWE